MFVSVADWDSLEVSGKKDGDYYILSVGDVRAPGDVPYMTMTLGTDQVIKLRDHLIECYPLGK